MSVQAPLSSADVPLLQMLHFDSSPLSAVSNQPGAQYRVTEMPRTSELIARSMITHNKTSAQTELWPVKSNDEPTTLENAITSTSLAPCIHSQVDRLKIAALTAQLSRSALLQFASDRSRLVNALLPGSLFDFQSATCDQRSFEHDLAMFRNYTQQHLILLFKHILSVLLSRFSIGGEERFDQTVLKYVATFDNFVTQFDYTDCLASLARQYVYSALYDGQLLQFSTSPAISPVPLLPHHFTGDAANVIEATAGMKDNALDETLVSIEKRTTQVFQQHSLFNELILQCSKTADQEQCAAMLTHAVTQLRDLAEEKSAWTLLKTSFLGYDSAKSLAKARKLCCLALTNKVALSSGVLDQMDTCGFFDDHALLAAILDSGCLQFLEKREARLFLLGKLDPHVESIIDATEINVSMQRILWILFVASSPLTRSELKTMQVKQEDIRHTKISVDVMQKIYNWIAVHVPMEKRASRHKLVHNFLLRHKQYYLALVAQEQVASVLPHGE